MQALRDGIPAGAVIGAVFESQRFADLDAQAGGLGEAAAGWPGAEAAFEMAGHHGDFALRDEVAGCD